MFKQIILAGVFTAALAASATPVLARAGDGVSIGRDAKISVTQDGPVSAAAIGQNVKAYNLTGVVAGDVTIGRDVSITVKQKGPVTAAAIGQNATAANVTGVITSKTVW